MRDVQALHSFQPLTHIFKMLRSMTLTTTVQKLSTYALTQSMSPLISGDVRLVCIRVAEPSGAIHLGVYGSVLRKELDADTPRG
jgi:hypothetical protein